MKATKTWALIVISVISMVSVTIGQNEKEPIVPTFVKYSGTLTDASGRPVGGTVEVTFSLYKEQQGGPSLWMETQKVDADTGGNYTVALGLTTSQGLPASLFVAGEARWLGVQIAGQAEQPHVMLLAVPYAMKSGDAATLGGLPPSAFLKAGAAAIGTARSGVSADAMTEAATSVSPAASNVTTTGGTVNTIPLFSKGTNIQNSILTQTGTTAINVGGKLNLAAAGLATAASGKTSRPEAFVASAFNSATAAAVTQTFQLKAEPAANNTASPSGTLNLLYSSGSAAPTETGLAISSKGLLTFAPGQTFPGTDNGTITGVTAGTALTGGGTTGTVTLSLDTTAVPELTTNNTFAGTEQFKGAVGVGVPPMANGYTPLTVGTANSFGTWLALANTSAGGRTWNVISAGSGNAEGAGNLGITDLTGKSTIWLEGTVNVTNGLTAITPNYMAALLQGPESGVGSALEMQTTGTGGDSWQILNTGATSAQGPNKLNFRNDSTGTDVMTLTADASGGHVGIGTLSPYSNVSFEVVGQPSTEAMNVYGWGANDSLDVFGGIAPDGLNGGTAIYGVGGEGTGTTQDGYGGVFLGGNHNGPNGTGFGDALLVKAGTGAAAQFYGSVYIAGNLSKSGGSFKIDHPLDPANKFLYHSFVESPDMMNIYNGMVTLDATGEATIAMPDWFSALNRDFRYQLTAIGAPSPNLYIAEELTNNQFKIGGGTPGIKVSWQVTGVRQDEWANAHRIPLEEAKKENERGFYLHPELYGAPEDKQMEWAHHPETMRRLQELRKKATASTHATMAKR